MALKTSIAPRSQFAAAEASVSFGPERERIPDSFLGISSEYWSLGIFDRHAPPAPQF
jgi:hypothetical protein